MSTKERPTPETTEALRRTQGLFRAAAETNGFASFARSLEKQRDELRGIVTELLVSHGPRNETEAAIERRARVLLTRNNDKKEGK
jgi:glyoxylase-like metal-dependent hydrolase (beta-lactamase superfamily II)